MSDPTALLLSLLIGVVGAAVGVVGLLAVQGWQLKVAKDQAKAASRLIYLEITYNVSVLEATARIGTGGVPLLVSSQLWQQHSDKLVNLLREDEVAKVAAPYVLLDGYRYYFTQHWLELAAGRARGTDVQLLKQLATSFQDAESTLRPKVWTGPRLTALGKEMEARLPIEIQLTPISRVERFMRAIPVEVLMRIAVGTLVLRLALEVGDRVLKRLRRND